MPITFTKEQADRGYLVYARMDNAVVFSGLGKFRMDAKREVCLLLVRDPMAGAQDVRGLAATTWLIGAYFLGDEQTNRALLLANASPLKAVTFPDYSRRAGGAAVDFEKLFKWHFKALGSLIISARLASGEDLMGTTPSLTMGKIFKGSTVTNLTGKNFTPEAYLAMALKQAMPDTRQVSSGVKGEWNAEKVYKYGKKVAEV